MSKNRNPNTELDPKEIHPMRKLSDHKYSKNLPTNLQCNLSYRNIVHNRRLANSRKPKIKTKKKHTLTARGGTYLPLLFLGPEP
jgi:hypothetical protein